MQAKSFYIFYSFMHRWLCFRKWHWAMLSLSWKYFSVSTRITVLLRMSSQHGNIRERFNYLWRLLR